MFSWGLSEKPTAKVDSLSTSQASVLYSLRTEEKTQSQYSSKVNVLAKLTTSNPLLSEKFGKAVVASFGRNQTFDIEVLRDIGNEKDLWATLLTTIATDPQFAMKSRKRSREAEETEDVEEEKQEEEEEEEEEEEVKKSSSNALL